MARDRGIRLARGDLPADLGAWEQARRAVMDDLQRQGFHRARGAFTQAYGSTNLDASALALPLRNVLPSADLRVRVTVDRIAEGLGCDGLLQRYRPEVDDGLSAGEGAFPMLSFWLADCYAEMGHLDDARARFERLLATGTT